MIKCRLQLIRVLKIWFQAKLVSTKSPICNLLWQWEIVLILQWLNLWRILIVHGLLQYLCNYLSLHNFRFMLIFTKCHYACVFRAIQREFLSCSLFQSKIIQDTTYWIHKNIILVDYFCLILSIAEPFYHVPIFFIHILSSRQAIR